MVAGSSCLRDIMAIRLHPKVSFQRCQSHNHNVCHYVRVYHQRIAMDLLPLKIKTKHLYTYFYMDIYRLCTSLVTTYHSEYVCACVCMRAPSSSCAMLIDVGSNCVCHLCLSLVMDNACVFVLIMPYDKAILRIISLSPLCFLPIKLASSQQVLRIISTYTCPHREPQQSSGQPAPLPSERHILLVGSISVFI